MLNLAKAIAIAAKAHQHQTDKSGKPYILHCLTVMDGVKQYNDEELSIIAVLHDIIEDTDWFLETVAQHGRYEFAIASPGTGPIEISQRVYIGLSLLTHKKGVPYTVYIDDITSTQDSIRVKMSDIRHNSDITRLKGITEKDLIRTAKYHKSYTILKKFLKE